MCGDAAGFCEKDIIAVTGSNGKTTVATLITEIIKKSGRKACLCGNVGFPFSDFVLDSAEFDYIVIEVSSFQMESVLSEDSEFRLQGKSLSVEGFSPKVSVLLNFSQNPTRERF